jgi:hypothetical protein
MLRLGIYLVGAVFTLAVYYRAIAPAVEDVLGASDSAMSASGPLAGLGLLDQLGSILLIWGPLIFGVGAVLIAFAIGFGRRGTSFRP